MNFVFSTLFAFGSQLKAQRQRESRNSIPARVETVESDLIPNPALLAISDVEVISYEAATEDEPNATLVVK